MQVVNEPSTTNILSELQLPEEYREQFPRNRIFQSPQSLVWFMRKHRSALTEAQAVKKIAGRVWIQPSRFDQVVVQTSQEPGR